MISKKLLAIHKEEAAKANSLFKEWLIMRAVKRQTQASLTHVRELKVLGMEQKETFEEALLGLSIELEAECELILSEYQEQNRQVGEYVAVIKHLNAVAKGSE